MYLWITVDQFPGHDGNIPGRGHMGGGLGESAAVLKIGVCHAKTLGPLVHHGHKFRFPAGDILCHGYGSIVAGGHDDTFD